MAVWSAAILPWDLGRALGPTAGQWSHFTQDRPFHALDCFIHSTTRHPYKNQSHPPTAPLLPAIASPTSVNLSTCTNESIQANKLAVDCLTGDHFPLGLDDKLARLEGQGGQDPLVKQAALAVRKLRKEWKGTGGEMLATAADLNKLVAGKLYTN